MTPDETTTTAPNWRKWAHIPEVRLWQACLLSLNIDPDAMKFDRHFGWKAMDGNWPMFDDDSIPDKNVRAIFKERVQILAGNNRRHTFRPVCTTTNGISPCESDVCLPEFTAWAISVGWEGLPPELVSIAQKREALTPDPSTPAKVGAGDRAADDPALPWAGEATSALPVTAKEIAAAFPVTWVDKWPERLKKAAGGKSYQWLTGTVVHRGSPKPGDANTYNPAAVAVALALHGDMTRAACDAAIKRCFPAWLDEWNSKAEYLKS